MSDLRLPVGLLVVGSSRERNWSNLSISASGEHTFTYLVIVSNSLRPSYWAMPFNGSFYDASVIVMNRFVRIWVWFTWFGTWIGHCRSREHGPRVHKFLSRKETTGTLCPFEKGRGTRRLRDNLRVYSQWHLRPQSEKPCADFDAMLITCLAISRGRQMASPTIIEVRHYFRILALSWLLAQALSHNILQHDSALRPDDYPIVTCDMRKHLPTSSFLVLIPVVVINTQWCGLQHASSCMSQWDVASLLSCSFSGTLHKDDKCQEDVFSDGSSDFAIKGSPHILFSLFSLDLFCPLESIVLKKDCSQEIILRAEGGQLPLITVADLPQRINSNRTRWCGVIERSSQFVGSYICAHRFTCFSGSWTPRLRVFLIL